ncbi:UNVERIFIED_CONTAM: hypothetical protein K2H54_002022 [Gekko kuhli]
MLRQAYRVCAKNEATIRELDDKIIFSSEPMEMQSLIQQRELLKSKTDKIEEEIVMLKQMVQKTTRELEGTNVGTSTVDDAHISNNSDVLQVSSEQHPITNIPAARRDPSSPIVISSSPEIYPAKRRKKGDEEKSTKRISKKSPRKEIESWGEFNCMFRYELSPDSQEVRDDLLQRNRRQEQERQEHDRDTDFDPYATLSDEPTNPFWAAEEETDLYDNIENPDTELTPQECRDWCSQAIQMLKVRTERIKAEVDWQLHRQQNQPAEPTPSTPAPTRRAHKKSRLAPITFPIKIPLIASLPPSSLPRYSGDSEDAEEDRGRGNHGNQRMAESEFEPMEETGGAGQARRDGEVTVSRAHQTQQGDPSPRGPPQTATVLPSDPTPQGENFEESPGPSLTVTSEGTEESVVEVEPERAQGQRKEPESIALVHPTPIPLPQRQSVKRKKPTTPNKEHSEETTDPCVAFLRDIDLELLVDGEQPQQHHISLTADTPELGGIPGAHSVI